MKARKDLMNIFLLSLIIILVIGSCKKENTSNPQNTSGWSVVGNMDLNGVYDMYADKNGNLYAVGSFKNSSGKRFVAKWDGSKWSELGDLNIDNGIIIAISGDANGNIYVGGSFSNTNGNYYVAKWNGSTWTNIGYGDVGTGEIMTLCTDAAGTLYAGSDTRVFKYNGGWTKMNMDGFTHWVNTLLVSNGNLYVGGGAFTPGTGGTVARWNGNGWSIIGDLNSYEEAYTLCADANGTLYAGGGFSFTSGYVVKWNGTSWMNLNLNGNDVVKSVCTDSKGNLYAGGSFSNSKNKFYVAKWDGSGWTDLGLNAYSGIFKMLYLNGNLYVAGQLAFQLNSGHYIAVRKIE